MPFDAAPYAPATITTTVSTAAVFDAVLDLRIETLRAIARCNDIADRLKQRPSPAEVTDAPL
jgi:hypothetical protein